MDKATHCFCLLALGDYYCGLAAQTIVDLQHYAPGREVYVYTDRPSFFSAFGNVKAFQHRWTGLKRPYNDKRFPIKRALEDYETAICIDADTRFSKPIPRDLHFRPGIEAAEKEPVLIHQPEASTPRLVRTFERIGQRTGVDPQDVYWIQESLWSLTQTNDGKIDTFFELWDLLALEFQLNGLHVDGHPIGFASRALGWEIRKDAAIAALEDAHYHTFHHVRSLDLIPHSRASRLRRLASYHYWGRYALRAVRTARFGARYLAKSGWKYNTETGLNVETKRRYRTNSRETAVATH